MLRTGHQISATYVSSFLVKTEFESKLEYHDIKLVGGWEFFNNKFGIVFEVEIWKTWQQSMLGLIGRPVRNAFLTPFQSITQKPIEKMAYKNVHLKHFIRNILAPSIWIWNVTWCHSSPRHGLVRIVANDPPSEC